MTGMMKLANWLSLGPRSVAVLALGAMTLSGCAPVDPYALVSCPTLGVLAEASEITRFRHGGERDISDMTWHGEIESVDFTCVQPEGKDVVIAEAQIVAKFTRGLAATSDRQFFNLFTVLSERQDKIVDKSIFPMDVKFKSGQRSVTVTETIKGIRVPTKGNVAPELYNVYFGFQLSPAEVAYNRTKERR